MDPVRVPEAPDPLPRGPSLFIPFEAYNFTEGGKYDQKLATDLPPQKTWHEAKTFIANARLTNRRLSYIEYSHSEILKDPTLMSYLGIWKGRY